MKIVVKAIPNASKDGVAGWERAPEIGRVLKVRVSAPALEGRANEALRRVLAEWLRVPKSRVVLVKGANSCWKTFEVPCEPPPD